MDFCVGLVAIFVILDIISARSIDNRSLRNKRNSDGFQFQSNLPAESILSAYQANTVKHNPWLKSIVSNNSRNSLPSNNLDPQPSSTYYPYKIFNIATNDNPYNFNPFSSVNSIADTESSNSQEQYSASPPYGYTPAYTFNTIFNTQAQDNTIFRTSTPLKKVLPPVPHDRTLSPNDAMLIKLSPVKTMSEIKCEEYVREIVGIASVTTLIGDSSPGVRKVSNPCPSVNNLVIRGTDARVGEFPHMVALGRRSSDSNEFKLMCGGTLISHTWVLSAAHCTTKPDGSPNIVKIGIHKLSGQEGNTVDVKDIIKHPDFEPPAMYADIALIKLVNPVTFSTFVRPACLYHHYGAVPRKAWISGWGVTEIAGDNSDTLQKAQLDVINNQYCSRQYNSSAQIPHGVRLNMMCAGDSQGKWSRDACQGDSGGPLQVHPENECLYQVIGITSFIGCGVATTPAIYTRVSYYLSWIEENVWPQGQ